MRTTWRRLPLLHPVLLLSMPFLKLLRLLLMPLLHLLLSRFIGILLDHLLVLFLLLLLELLPLLILLLLKFRLLSLVLLIQFLVPGVGGARAIHWRKLIWMRRIGATSSTRVRRTGCAIRWRMVRSPGLTGGNRIPSAELPCSLGGRYWRIEN